jgi:hypothetical protein
MSTGREDVDFEHGEAVDGIEACALYPPSDSARSLVAEWLLLRGYFEGDERRRALLESAFTHVCEMYELRRRGSSPTALTEPTRGVGDPLQSRVSGVSTSAWNSVRDSFDVSNAATLYAESVEDPHVRHVLIEMLDSFMDTYLRGLLRRSDAVCEFLTEWREAHAGSRVRSICFRAISGSSTARFFTENK